MKQKITFFKVLLTLVLLCGVGNAWGEEEWKHVFLSPEKISDNAITVNGATWNVSTTPGQGSPEISTGKYSDIYGLKFGSSKSNYYGSVTFTTSYFTDKKVTKVVCRILNNGSKTGTLTATQGDKTINTTSKSFGSSWTYLTLDGEAEGGNIGNGGNLSITYQVQQAFYVSSIVVTYKNKTSETYTVTFDAGTNGECSTSSLTETSAGAGITLPSCTANDGYVFKGWSTTENGTTADAGIAGATYKPSSNCTLYAVYNKLYTVTIETPENGTLVVKNGDTPVESGSSFEDGTTFTVEATPNDGYKFRNWQAVDKTTHTYTASNTGNYTLGGNDLTFKANFDELSIFTINYMVNGVNTNAQENVYESTTLVFPTVTELGGKVFVGWSDAEISTPTDEKPTLVSTEGLTASANATYYAVFATLTKGDSETKTDVVDREYTGVASGSTSYTNWSKPSGASNSGAAYAGNSAGSNNSIQLRWNSSDSKYAGIVTTVSGGIAKSITIEWYSDTSNGRTLNVYGSNTAFTSWDDIKNITSEPLGTIVKGTSTTLKIDGEYQYIALRSDNGAMYLTSISIDWVQGAPDSYSAYCTTVTPKTQNVKISDAGYATAYIPFAATVEGATAYYVTVSGNKAQLNEIEGTIPANTGVVLKGNEGTVTFTESAVEPESVDGNLLIGTAKEGGEDFEDFEDSNYTYYILSKGENGIGFYWDGSGKYNGREGMGAHCAQYKAVLAVPNTSAGAPSFFTFDDATAINAISNVKTSSVRYNLNGQAVGEDYKGIVIVNGKKMFNK